MQTSPYNLVLTSNTGIQVFFFFGGGIAAQDRVDSQCKQDNWLNQQNLPELHVAVNLYFPFKISSESNTTDSNPMWGTLENWKL